MCVSATVKDDDWQKAWDKSSGVPGLKKYLRRYKRRFRKNKQLKGRFYDWGDDPSFFAAERFLGDVRKAGWGVCRRYVREKLNKGDFVVFFCAQQQEHDLDLWKYYYVGLGTVDKIVENRKDIWVDNDYKRYRGFYNLLMDAEGENCEVVGYHPDWRDRAEAPYIIFGKRKTHFNVRNPVLVAEYRTGDSVWRHKVLETWCIENEDVHKIYGLVPKREGGKKLRGSPIERNAHPRMNLAKLLSNNARRLKKRRKKLLKISRKIAKK